MFIDRIKDLNLKEPALVKVSIEYIAECTIGDDEYYGEGATEEAAIADLEEVIYDIYEDLSEVTRFLDEFYKD